MDDTEINYARVGTGDHPVLLLPGALGKMNFTVIDFLRIEGQLGKSCTVTLSTLAAIYRAVNMDIVFE